MIHIINEAERDLPVPSYEIYSLEQDASKTNKINTIDINLCEVSYKKYNFTTWKKTLSNSTKFETVDMIFPSAANSFWFPKCEYFRMIRP